MNFIQEHVGEYFSLALERWKIRERKRAGQPKPWTEDLTLRMWRFCNTFRYHDKVSEWAVENIYKPLKDDPFVFQSACLVRWFNYIPTLEILLPMIHARRWQRKKAISLLKDREQLVSGAYLIRSPHGISKLEGVCDIIDHCDKYAGDFTGEWHPENSTPWTFQEFTRLLQAMPYFGYFMAYQVALDLRDTFILQNAMDRDNWAQCGPGAAQGIGYLVSGDLKQFNYGSQPQQEVMLVLMRRLRTMVNEGSTCWPEELPRWAVCDIQHWACEYHKWIKAKMGFRPKRYYR